MTAAAPLPAAAGAASGRVPGGSGFDFPGLLRCAFGKPVTPSLWVVGSCMVALTPLFGLGGIALLGFLVHTTRRTLEAQEFRLAEWSGFGRLLADGLRALLVLLVHVVAANLGWLLLALVIDTAVRATGIGVAGAMGGFALAAAGLLMGVLGFALVPSALLALATHGRLREAFAVAANLDLIRTNARSYGLLVLALILIFVLTGATLALCGVGIVPGIFWGVAMAGAAIGHAGLRMGLRRL